jgi:hypothetical protein
VIEHCTAAYGDPDLDGATRLLTRQDLGQGTGAAGQRGAEQGDRFAIGE